MCSLPTLSSAIMKFLFYILFMRIIYTNCRISLFAKAIAVLSLLASFIMYRSICVHSSSDILGALSVGIISCQSETVRKIGSETNTHVVITSDSVHNHSGECCIISHISSLISRLLRKPGTKAAPVTPYNFTRSPHP